MISFLSAIVSTINIKIDLSTSDLVIVFDGDSLTRGFNNAQIEQYYPKEVDAYLTGKSNTKEFYSYGVGGQSTVQMINDANTQIYPKAQTGKENVLIAWEDVNAILNDGRTAQQNFDDFETYFAGAKAAGFQHCVLITGYYPRELENGTYHNTSWTQNDFDKQHDYFELVKNANINNQSWDYHIDLRNVDGIGGPRDQTINANFSDSVHLFASGYDLVADKVIQELNKIFKIS